MRKKKVLRLAHPNTLILKTSPERIPEKQLKKSD